MTQAVSQRLESIQLVTQTAFGELTQNQLMAQIESKVLIQIDSWLKMLPDFFSIQIDLWLKTLPDFSIQINFWLKRKTFDS